MAKLERKMKGDFDSLLKFIEEGMTEGTCELEDKSDYHDENGVRCSVRVFERYSVLGSNRVSLNVTLFQDSKGIIHITAISSGGSEAVFFKLNTLGEEAFLDKFEDLFE